MANVDERSVLDFYGLVARVHRLTHICGHASYFSNTRYIVVIMMPISTWEIQSSRGRTCPTSHIGLIYIASLLIGEKKKDNPPRNGMKKQSSLGTVQLSFLIAR